MKDIGNILAGLKTGMDLIQQVAPLAALGGPAVAGVASIIAGLSQVAETAIENVETGVIAAGTDDQEQLKEILAELQRKNNALDDDIRNG